MEGRRTDLASTRQEARREGGQEGRNGGQGETEERARTGQRP